MLFSKTFEIGAIVIGLLWVCDQILDSLIHFYDISISVEMQQQEIPESVKHMYS